MKNNPLDYINDSGGAKGADLQWDRIGRDFGVIDHRHWRPKDIEMLLEEEIKILEKDFVNAANALERPTHFEHVNYCKRDWLQVNRGSEAVFAVSRIVNPGEVDLAGYTNKTGKQIVMGGTGWTVQMAIQKGMPVYVFDMNTNNWCEWSYINTIFIMCPVPELTKHFTGIGSQFLTPEGIGAIRAVYSNTFES